MQKKQTPVKHNDQNEETKNNKVSKTKGKAVKTNWLSFDGKPFLVDKPIEFKKVNVDSLKEDGYNIKYDEVFYDENGYLDTSILEKVNINEHNTVFINVATGTGKTTAVYKMISDILKNDRQAIVIMATPFISLVEKDAEKLIDKYKINKDLITNYKNLTDDINKEISTYPNIGYGPIIEAYVKDKLIHIMTINALLRNPGELAFFQKPIKSNYLNYIIDQCKKRNYKVYLFLDEIHASIHNFKNEYIHYLTMWKGIVHKCIVSTATHTEPVNVALKHLAYLTGDNIQIIEASRKKAPKQSKLDIAFFNEEFSSKKITNLIEFLDHWISSNLKSESSRFHILSYSKKIAKEIYNKLPTKFGKVKLYISETPKEDKEFEAKYNSIGTSFYTGIDIDEENHLLIIIFPVKYGDYTTKGEEGIFTDGLPSILQSIARLRKSGSILFIIPPIKGYIIDEPTLNMLKEINKYKIIEKDKIKEKNKKITAEKEMFIDNEIIILKDYLKKQQMFLLKEIENYNKQVSDIKNERELKGIKEIKRPEIQYPKAEAFILERGQEYLKYASMKSGKYITPYVIWATVNNQFINCSLDKVYDVFVTAKFLNIKSENYQKYIIGHIDKYLDSAETINNFSDYYKKVLPLFKMVTVYEHDTTSETPYPVIIMIDGKKSDYSTLIKSNKFYFSIVADYYEYEVKEYDLEEYLKFNLLESKEPYYNMIRLIKNRFLDEYLGKNPLNREIEKNPVILKIKQKIITSIEELKVKDDVVRILIKEMGRKLLNTSDKQIIETFLKSFVERDKKSQSRKRIIR
jgi:hypothetical protein